MTSQPASTSSSRTLWVQRFLFAGLTASVFGIVAFVCSFVFAVRLGIEETFLNMTVIWTVIVTLVAAVGTYGLVLGFRHCETTLLRMISIGIPVCVIVAILYVWISTDLKLGIFIWGVVLLPASGVIAICGFVASLFVSFWWQPATRAGAG